MQVETVPSFRPRLMTRMLLCNINQLYSYHSEDKNQLPAYSKAFCGRGSLSDDFLVFHFQWSKMGAMELKLSSELLQATWDVVGCWCSQLGKPLNEVSSLSFSLSQEKFDTTNCRNHRICKAILLEILDPIREGAAETFVDSSYVQEVGWKLYLVIIQLPFQVLLKKQVL